MASKTLLYIGAGILFLIGVCLFGYGVLSVIGSTSAQGSSNWMSFGLGFGWPLVLLPLLALGLLGAHFYRAAAWPLRGASGSTDKLLIAKGTLNA